MKPLMDDMDSQQASGHSVTAVAVTPKVQRPNRTFGTAVRWGLLIIVLCRFESLAFSQPKPPTHVLTGAEVLLRQGVAAFEGKRVGLVCNQTSVLPNGTHLADTLLALHVRLVALFGPEHGIRGAAAAGSIVNDSLDARTHLPVRSLYGKTRKPTPAMLSDVDILVFDLQDVGARYYTYAATMGYCMEACADQGKTFMLLDRPNPINGIDVEGPVIDSTLKSFIGFFPVPIRYGMTLGELAQMALGESWLRINKKLDFRVIRMEGWQRTMWYDETGLPWVPPSPNMKSTTTASLYPGTCLFEATNLSEGRGTELPFENMGAPWINGQALADSLNTLKLRGLKFEAVTFTPKASPAAPSPRFKDTTCQGVKVSIVNRDLAEPIMASLQMFAVIKRMYPARFELLQSNFERLFGVKGYVAADPAWSHKLENPFIPWQPQIDRFRGARGKYLIY